MDTATELIKLHSQIETLANSERFGANYQDYKPNSGLYEGLVRRFFDLACSMELPVETLRKCMDGQESISGWFLFLNSRGCKNKFEQMQTIFSDIDQVMNEIIEYWENKSCKY